MAGIGKSALADGARGTRALRRRCRTRGQLFAISRQCGAVAGRAHARAAARVLPGPATGGAAERVAGTAGSRGSGAGRRGLAGPAARTRHRRTVVTPRGGRPRAPPADAPGPRRLARPHGGVDTNLGVGRRPPLGRPDHRGTAGAPGHPGGPRHDDRDHEPVHARGAVGGVGRRHRAGTATGEGGGRVGHGADRRRAGPGCSVV